MFIVRVDVPGYLPEIRTFSFQNEKEMNTAAGILRRLHCKGFSAEVDSKNSTHGIIKDRWDNCGNRFGSLLHTVSSGRYMDTVSETYGLQDECERVVAETEDRASCWASRKASLHHVIGDLFKVVLVDPYTD